MRFGTGVASVNWHFGQIFEIWDARLAALVWCFGDFFLTPLSDLWKLYSESSGVLSALTRDARARSCLSVCLHEYAISVRAVRIITNVTFKHYSGLKRSGRRK